MKKVNIKTGEVDGCSDFSITTVKELADSGITQVPPIFLQPQTTQVPYGVRAEKIPVLDLTKLEGDGRTEILQQIVDAFETWGIFQVVNHGVPTLVMDRMMEAARRFNGEPIDEKMKYYNPADSTVLVHYGSGFSSHKTPAAEWKDAIRISCAPRSPHPSEWPAALRVSQYLFCNMGSSPCAFLFGVGCCSESSADGCALCRQRWCMPASPVDQMLAVSVAVRMPCWFVTLSLMLLLRPAVDMFGSCDRHRLLLHCEIALLDCSMLWGDVDGFVPSTGLQKYHDFKGFPNCGGLWLSVRSYIDVFLCIWRGVFTSWY